MVDKQLSTRDIHDSTVLEAMQIVPRHIFVEPETLPLAYADSALPIKADQTISQPYIVALMTQSAGLLPGDRVLEIGTGTGYQAAVLSKIVTNVFTIEIISPLATEARQRLKTLGYGNVKVKSGDGYHGWPEHAPFDAILITAATPRIPKPLIEQLKAGGRMVLPLGEARDHQDLLVLTKQEDGTLKRQRKGGVVFVPMTGEVRLYLKE